jgi:hypothetical protein
MAVLPTQPIAVQTATPCTALNQDIHIMYTRPELCWHNSTEAVYPAMCTDGALADHHLPTQMLSACCICQQHLALPQPSTSLTQHVPCMNTASLPCQVHRWRTAEPQHRHLLSHCYPAAHGSSTSSILLLSIPPPPPPNTTHAQGYTRPLRITPPSCAICTLWCTGPPAPHHNSRQHTHPCQ